ncbi:MFS transporter [Streptomyces sp. DH10]|uniref:MFS transporter n=1 Tax=Streptomyces sp. DH10 TaxID=3040121 RepID=UPI00244201FE|nr:MFS transporter [Streptomyces sp. DH10]MDG9712469.1 MFS transporter [Streptomyces sp. DH10]
MSGEPNGRKRAAGRATRLLLSILPKTPAGRRLAAGAAVDSVGSGMFLAASTLYFVTVVGLPAARVGLVLSAAAVAGLLSPMPLGWLADRVGPARVYVALLAMRGLGYAGFALVDSFWPYAVLTCVLTALDRGCSPLQQVVVGIVEGGQNQTRTMASIRSVRNIGLTAGFLLAGAVLAIEEQAAFVALFLGNALTFWVIAAVVEQLRRRAAAAADSAATTTPAVSASAAPAPSSDEPAPAAVRSPFRNLRFLLFTVSNGVLSLHDSVLFVLLPLWLTTATDAPSSAVSVLLAVNTVLTVLLQVYVARFAETTAGALRLIPVALIPLLVSCAAFAGAEHVPVWPAAACAVLAVVLLTLGENVHSVAVWNLSYELSPAPARARYLAAFSLGMTGQQIVGPVLMTGVLLPLGTAGWAVLAVVYALAAAVVRATGAPPRTTPAALASGPAPAPSPASSSPSEVTP